mmetsp:Transcript_62567/g.111517  ORF Transcript_62567/g.111517 Transcript_62567/m.111517 type:complete len:120 (+) Transcript_62567:927-1286(+)
MTIATSNPWVLASAVSQTNARPDPSLPTTPITASASQPNTTPSPEPTIFHSTVEPPHSTPMLTHAAAWQLSMPQLCLQIWVWLRQQPGWLGDQRRLWQPPMNAKGVLKRIAVDGTRASP